MELTTYLSFRGQCEEAFALYEAVLGAHIGEIYRYAGTELAQHAPADWLEKVVHGTITFGTQVIQAGDVTPERYEEPKGFTLSLNVSDATEAERMFAALATQGRVIMPLQQTFWARLFGMVVDRFGIPWQVNCSG